MADALAARREARRKRILENSQNRLGLISGKCGDIGAKGFSASSVCAPISSDYVTADDNDDNKFATPVLNGALAEEPSLGNLCFPRNEEVDEEILNSLTRPGVQSQDTTSFVKKLVMYNYDIVLLSITLQILHSLVTVSSENTFFLPLLIYDIIKIVGSSNVEESKFVSLLILLNVISPNKVQFLTRTVQLLTFILKDLCVFLFTTACLQALFISFKYDPVTL